MQGVIVEKRTRETISARIVWAGGEPDTVVEIKRAPYGHRLMAQLDSCGLAPAAIANELNALGVVTTQGNPWFESTVAQAIRAARKRETARKKAARG